MEKAILSIGSNIGDKKYYLDQVLMELQSNGVIISRKSAIYTTEPVDYTDQDDFFNRVLEIETGLDPFELLKLTQMIENKLGRVREFTYSPRTCDIDIITFGEELINANNLIIPHPRYQERLFVLKLIEETIPEFRDPASKKSITQLLEECEDHTSLEKAKHLN